MLNRAFSESQGSVVDIFACTELITEAVTWQLYLGLFSTGSIKFDNEYLNFLCSVEAVSGTVFYIFYG